MLKKLTNFINVIMEELEQDKIYKLNDDEVIYKDLTLALIPGSFKPPHKGHWEMVMNFIDKADKILILISNISTRAISSRPISMTNLKKLTKIKDFISKNELDQNEEIKLSIDLLGENINSLSFELLESELLKIEKICDQNAKNDERFIELKALITSYTNELRNNLFKSIRKTSTNKEIEPETSKEIFNIFIKAYNLQNKVDVQISESQSPVKDTINIINYNCKNCNILLGVSDKGGDGEKYNGIQNAILNDTINFTLDPVSVQTMLSATDLRNNITDLKKDYFPDKISDEDFEKIKALLN